MRTERKALVADKWGVAVTYSSLVEPFGSLSYHEPTSATPSAVDGEAAMETFQGTWKPPQASAPHGSGAVWTGRMARFYSAPLTSLLRLVAISTIRRPSSISRHCSVNTCMTARGYRIIYLRLLAGLPAFDAAPKGVVATSTFALLLSALGFFFSRLPFDIRNSFLPTPHRQLARKGTLPCA
jgi:hypothetical protein